MYVGISRDGRVFFRRMHVGPDELADLIRAALQAGSEKKVYIYADARVTIRELRRATPVETKRNHVIYVGIIPILDCWYFEIDA